MEKTTSVELAKRLTAIRDILSRSHYCDIITRRNTGTLYSNWKDYDKELTRERFAGTDEEWDMYREAQGLKDILGIK